jgi:hypothetical protein
MSQWNFGEGRPVNLQATEFIGHVRRITHALEQFKVG